VFMNEANSVPSCSFDDFLRAPRAINSSQKMHPLFGCFFTLSLTSSCHFASLFTTPNALDTSAKRNTFVDLVLEHDAKFLDEVVGQNGVTFDGFYLNDTGYYVSADNRHNFTAASKESLHLSLMAQYFANSTRAQTLFNNSVSGSTYQKVLNLLDRKLSAFEIFNNRWPGFGGFLPWIYNDGIGAIRPTDDWQHAVPALDNGEMIWALIALQRSLSMLKSTVFINNLVKRISRWLVLMSRTAAVIFYAGHGVVRCVTELRNTTDASFLPSNYYDGYEIERNLFAV
jgi:uncharacterized protein YggL (DUF469 family)